MKKKGCSTLFLLVSFCAIVPLIGAEQSAKQPDDWWGNWDWDDIRDNADTGRGVCSTTGCTTGGTQNGQDESITSRFARLQIEHKNSDISKPRVIVESSHTLAFGNNAFAMYEFDGGDNKLTSCYMDGAIWAPVYVEYPDDEKKSYGILANELFYPNLYPTYSFDDPTSWVVLPQTDLRVYRFEQGHRALRFNKEHVAWRSPLLTNIKNPIVVHPTLPYFVECNQTGFNIYSKTLFTDSQENQEEQCAMPIASYTYQKNEHVGVTSVRVCKNIIQQLEGNNKISPAFIAHAETSEQKLVYPSVTWHPTENKLLVKVDDHMMGEYNGNSHTIERKFPAKNAWIRMNPQQTVYVPATQQIIACGTPGGTLLRLYELRENAELRQLPISCVEHTDKEIHYNKILSVVGKYLVLECMFSDNPRFLGVCNLVTNALYKVHQFRTENGSVVFDPHTLKMFEMGHRVYYTYPDVCAVYNQECSILRLELPSADDSSSSVDTSHSHI